ncbi:MAG: serine/threonine protein kinase [Deltaproteobacteria bacterium]|nr:serine/threonine protein kinase [Deltaproteobacteria bacterium]
MRPSGSLLHGDVIDRYRILAHIADGGMAAVYLAERDGPGRFRKQVALKVIHRHLMRDRSFVQMFADEAQIAARLHHPNIVQTFDLVQTNEHLAIAMEYVPGLPASVLLPEDKLALGLHVSPELIAYLGAEVAAGLEHAHTLTDAAGEPLNVVHRDISPANVHIGFDGRIRIVDFGVARARGRLTSTSTGMLKGTLPYIAPEQLARGQPSPQSDLWSLGVVLWELAAGRRLFRRETEAETAHAVISVEVPPLGTIRPGFPTTIGAAIERALERDPARRWPSAAQMESLLRDALPSRIEPVRAPLVEALAPHRDRNLAEIHSILDAPDDPSVSVEVNAGSDEPSSLFDPAEEPTPMAVPDIPRVRHARRTGWLAAVGLGVGGLVFLVAHGGGDGGRPHSSGRRTTTAIERVSLEVSSGARGADAFLDDVRLGSLPVRTLVERDRAAHLLRVEAPGHLPEVRRVPLDAPVRLRIDLDPVASNDPPAGVAPRGKSPESRSPGARPTKVATKRPGRLRGLIFHEDPYR